jgi:hypothetical protein
MSDFVSFITDEKNKTITTLASAIEKKDDALIKKTCDDFVVLMNMLEYATRNKASNEDKKNERPKAPETSVKGDLFTDPFTSIKELEEHRRLTGNMGRDFSSKKTFVVHETEGLFEVFSNGENCKTYAYHRDRSSTTHDHYVDYSDTRAQLEFTHWHTVANIFRYGSSWDMYDP